VSRRHRVPSLIGLALAAVLAYGIAAAQGTAGGPAWSALTPVQQSALAPLKRDWQGIDAQRKQKWLEIAARFPAMPAEERQRIQERMSEWAQMSPDERGRARLQFQEARQISPQDRQARWDAYLALPPEEREALAQRADAQAKAKNAKSAKAPGAPAASAGPAMNQKVNVVNPPQTVPKPVAPTVVQAKPGASTTLMSKTATPPAHEKVGQPKIAASQGVVNRSTLLPQTGPQSGAAAPPASAPR
jgi:Protein of unknown function (DUF3106)